MCTVIVHVPAAPGEPVRLLAVRDEDPGRAWDALAESWPGTHPGVIGVRDRRAGGAWLAADPAAGHVAVILNRADQIPEDGAPLDSRGGIVLAAIAGELPSGAPRTHGFNLVDADARGARVVMWDGTAVRTVELGPGIHMIAHDDVDDAGTARITAWRDAFPAPGGEARWWAPWIDVLERTAELGPTDDRAIVRDNRPFGYPTLSLLACAASIDASGASVVYGEFDEPGAWNRLTLR